MTVLILVSILIVLIAVAIFLSKPFKELDLRSVAGFLVALVVILRYMTYTMLALPLYYVFTLVLGTEPRGTLTLSVPARIQLEPTTAAITGMGSTDLEQFIGNLHLISPDANTMLVTSIFIIITVLLLHFAFKKAQRVLKSVHDRNPFVEDNVKTLREVAVLGLLIWLELTVYAFYMAFYLQNHLEVEGFKLIAAGNLNLGVLIICGLIFVLSEVFRVGYELKSENELTV